MAADDIAGKFDNWYAAMAGSRRRDEIVQRHLGLPAAMLSSSLLPWEGIAEVVELLRLRAPARLVDLACGRGGYGLEVAARTGASLIGVDFSVEAIRQAEQYAGSLGRDARFVVADIAATGLPTASVGRGDVHRRRPARLRAGRRVRRAPPGAPAWRACRGHQLGGAGSDDDALPEYVRRVDCAARFAAAGFIDIAVAERPVWEQRERALWAAAAILDPAGDDAVAALRDEAIEVMPYVPLTRRVLASATAPPLPVAH